MDAKIGFIGLTPESSRDPDLQLLGSNQENEYSHYFRLVRYSNGRNMSGRQKLQILNAIQQKQINFSFLIFFFFPFEYRMLDIHIFRHFKAGLLLFTFTA